MTPRHVDCWTLKQLMAANDWRQRCVWFAWDEKRQALVPFVRSNGKGPSGCEALGPDLFGREGASSSSTPEPWEAPGNKT